MFLRKYRKMLGLRKILEHSQIFALIFQKKHSKSLGYRKILKHSQIQKKSRKNVFSIGLAFAGFEPDQF